MYVLFEYRKIKECLSNNIAFCFPKKTCECVVTKNIAKMIINIQHKQKRGYDIKGQFTKFLMLLQLR